LESNSQLISFVDVHQSTIVFTKLVVDSWDQK
jgi:hypothetical protein